MLTKNSAKTLRHATAGVELAHRQPVNPLQNLSLDRPAYGLNCRYWIRDLLLSGEQGQVYQAHDLSLNVPCSVKRIDPFLKVTSTLQERFLHEAEILVGISHPNIVAVYECTRDEQGNLFSVMEPLDGCDLRSILAQGTVIPLEHTLEILCSVGAALQYVHALDIVHQDINPSSIFLNKERSRTALASEVVKVMNFGLAKQLTSASRDLERNLHLGLVFDSPTYLAPEALELSNESVDGRSDQWSLAVVAYQMLSGQLPFWDNEPWGLRALIRGAEAPTPLAELMPELPSYVSQAIHKALCKDKAQRFGSIADFVRALHGLPALASRQTKPELRADLIDQCRAVSLLTVPPTALPIETPTREYPALSFPAELLAAADDERKLEPLPGLPVPRISPPWTAGPVAPQPRGVSRRLLLVSCLLIALSPAPVVAALHYLHAAQHTRVLSHGSSPQSVLPQPRVAIASPPSVLDALPLAPPVRVAPVARRLKPAQSHRAHLRASLGAGPDSLNADACRDQILQKNDQAILAEGLGL